MNIRTYLPSVQFYCFLLLSMLQFRNTVLAQAGLGISEFYVSEKQNEAIGFSAFDVSTHSIQHRLFGLNGGMRFIGAFDGNRGGYFAFGYFCEGTFFPTRKVQLGFSSAFLAGGGALAPDKDGWMSQSNSFLAYRTKSGVRFRAGINYTYVSSGFIQGFSPLIGINWKLNLPAKEEDSCRTVNMQWVATYAEIGGARFGEEALAFVGAGASYTIGQHFSGDIVLHALTNTYGGYMQLLTAFGPNANIKRFHFTPAIVGGLGGGGAVQTKSGTLYGLQFTASYTGKKFYTSVKYQGIRASSEKFHYQGIFVSLGKTLNSESKIPWYAAVKAYPTAGGFGNLGARFVAFENQHFTFMGSTYWACTHNRGAYAEGLFEVAYRPALSVPIYAIFSGGAGGGAAINKKTSAQIISAGIGFSLPKKTIPLSLELAVWKGGNIPSWSLTTSYRF